jgi:hypothetical protein
VTADRDAPCGVGRIGGFSKRGGAGGAAVADQSLALTFGVPIIGPDEGVIREQLSEVGGCLYEPGNVESAASAMRTVARMSELDVAAAK